MVLMWCFSYHDHKPHNSIETNKDGNEVLCLDPANNAQRVAVATITLAPVKKKIKVVSSSMLLRSGAN